MHPTHLKGLHAVVTGGGRGIGAAIATALAAEGVRLTLTGRNRSRLAEFAASLETKVHLEAFDIAQPEAVAQAMQRAVGALGAVSILINNAGQAESQPFLKTSPELWGRMLEVNLTGTFLATQAALPSMLGAGWGRIVNVASTAGLTGYPYVSAYVAAKHGVIGLTRALALELAQKNVTVNAVCPGFTETDILHHSVSTVVSKTGRSEEQARRDLLRSNPLGRFVQPEEVARAVLWLCQPGSAAVTGQAIAVAGGEVM